MEVSKTVKIFQLVFMYATHVHVLLLKRYIVIFSLGQNSQRIFSHEFGNLKIVQSTENNA